jgi:hypothetical protein
MEQPGCRKSKPASVRMTSRPSSMACSRTTPDGVRGLGGGGEKG